MLRDFSDPEAAKLLINEVRDDDRLVITNVHAKDARRSAAADAAAKSAAARFCRRRHGRALHAADSQAVRRLQSGLRADARPAEEAGHSAGKVEALYRVPKPEEIEKPCKECGGLGFKGRTGLFELLVVDDKIREILVKQPKLDLLRKAARWPACAPFQEEGLLLVAKGVTSLAELQRVLKE